MSGDGYGWDGIYRIRARYQPKRRETLKPELERYIGQVFEFTYAGHMDEGPYAGQLTWSARREDTPIEGFWQWTAIENLEEIEAVRAGAASTEGGPQ